MTRQSLADWWAGLPDAQTCCRCGKAGSKEYAGHPVTHENDDCYLIPTLEGTMKLNRGDMLITGVRGEIYPCKMDIFAATYAPAPSGEAPVAPHITFSQSPPNTDATCPMLWLEVLGVVTTNPDWDDCEIAEYLNKPAFEVSEALHGLAAMGLVNPSGEAGRATDAE